MELRVIDRGVGGVTETNVNLASASDAIIIGFNVRAEGKATELANREGVEIRYYSVIYQAIDEIESALKGMLKPVYEERELGRAEIRADLPVVEGRQHRRLPGHLRHHPAQLEGAAAARQRRGRARTSPCSRCAGRRTTSPRCATATNAV